MPQIDWLAAAKALGSMLALVLLMGWFASFVGIGLILGWRWLLGYIVVQGTIWLFAVQYCDFAAQHRCRRTPPERTPNDRNS